MRRTRKNNYRTLLRLQKMSSLPKNSEAQLEKPAEKSRIKYRLTLKLLLLFSPTILLGIAFRENPDCWKYALLALGVALIIICTGIKNHRLARERQILFQLPLVMESLILLVESGLGILPAIEKIAKTNKEDHNSVSKALAEVYRLSSGGLSLNNALEKVAARSEVRILKHILLHLDISGNEGGELIPSLQSLSEHAYTEWKVSVERRIKRLESMVVFPVFVSVLGLMLLSAAAPLAPLIDLGKANKINRVEVYPE